MNDSVDALRARLRQTHAAISENARAAVSAQGEVLVAAIRERAPDKSGRLKQSIRLQLSDDGMTATVTAGEGIEGMQLPVGHHRTVVGAGGKLSKSEHVGVFARVVDVNLHGKDIANEGVTEYDYVLAAEFGTYKERARPFFFPTYHAKKSSIRSAIASAMTAPIRALWG